MIVTETGKYRLTQDWSSRGSISIAHFGKGHIIIIDQVDPKNRKVIGPALLDWVSWKLPVEPVTNSD
ncbi:hypothetical protein LCGC14_2080330 [marine sediment metagenome]|uniref:Uncharacterized protein n=1 Tax=marine sediment metagenome TaxID=412755 RepID=A0A0F9F359_9ZZZZ